MLYLSNLHSSLKEPVATKDSATQANYLSVKGGQSCLYIITSLTFSHHCSCLSLLSKNVCAWVIGVDTFLHALSHFFNYNFFLFICPSLSESLRGVEVCGETVVEDTGSEHQKVSWHDYGFHLSVPDGAVSSDVTVSLAVKAIMSGQFQLPDDTHLVSSIYWVSASQLFEKEVSVHLEHCAIINSEEETSNYKFIIGRCSQKNLPYKFKIRDAVFSLQSHLGTITVRQFSFFAAIY